MKSNQEGKSKMTHPQTQAHKRPQNKDVIDSREGEEQTTKGDSTTHNRKEKKSDRRRVKNMW
ncbi:hypothetical protein [Niabella soli]|uniref:Uncharacterized protein n=1 Tax=Niabella soli DSM 19437 TaxID=929713 RepID=W0F2D0_9BACT|nr:hypothetical protein [Niabella soli]AHF17185.1 hypothetical protein NIASO_03275 [Niabella soli DSM 19437]